MARKTLPRAVRRARPPEEKPAAGDTPARGRPYPVVGVGASAGGFEAFRDLLRALPSDTGMAFVLVQHLDPGHESMLTKLLSSATAMPVREVREGMAVEPNHVYVIPPNTTMGIAKGTLHLMARGEAPARHLPIDDFLRSLAADRNDLAIGVILSGTASDGTLGLKAIKAEGGITFAQDCQSAKYDGMPRAAAAAGCVDFVLPPKAIARELARIGRNPYAGIVLPARAAEPAVEEDDLRQIFAVLQRATGVDFTYYRYSTIQRRIARRMLLHKLESPRQYVKVLQENQAEPAALCEDILVHVTGFFREPETFRAMVEWVFPRILDSKPPGEPVRVWVPGCSTGEEAYSIAMALLEYLGDRAGGTPVQIFGTDVSEAAIETARVGVYVESTLVEVSAERLRRFFVQVEGGHQIARSIREMCVFARQDVAKDPPFSRLDLISCRNLLIYMGPVLQQKVMANFHYALRPTGFLTLGKSESASRFGDLFTLVERKHKIYSRNPSQRRPDFDLPGGVGQENAVEKAALKPDAQRLDAQAEADRIVLSQYAPAGLVVDENLRILHFRGQCSAYLSPPPGEASLGLLRMVRPELAADLRTAIHRAKKNDEAVRKEGIQVRRGGHLWEVRVDVIPFQGNRPERFFLILFQETPAPEPAATQARGKTPAGSKRQELESTRLRRELEKTKEYLQAIIQEHEATNEELKATNEEALSSNEELQSANEELETAKEELQSANEELVTLNDQLQMRNVELGQLNSDLTNVLDGVNIPILILSTGRRIRRFTPQAGKLLNLLPGDVGRPIDNIRTNIDVPDLAGLIAEAVDAASVREREVQDRAGRWYSLRIRPYRTTDGKIEGAVVIFIDIDEAKRIQIELRREQNFTAAVLESAAAFVLVTDTEGRIVRFNEACRRLSGYSFEDVRGKPVWDVLVPPVEAETLKQLYTELAESRSPREHEDYWVDRSGRRHLISWHCAVIREAPNAASYVVRVGVDITAVRRAEEALQESERMLRRSQADLRALTAGLLKAQEEERRRLARELHDDIGQRLAALSIQVEVLHRPGGVSPDEIEPKLGELAKQIEVLAEDLRRTAHDLHPFMLTHLGLDSALRSYCDEFSHLRRIKVRFTARALPAGAVPPAVALCAYRVIQEALGNIAKHAGVEQAMVSLGVNSNALHISVRDEGHGFELDQVRGKGLGLVSMEERVRHLGGTFSIVPKPGDGTVIEIRIPFEPSPPGAAEGAP